MVMGDDSCLQGCGFKSLRHILDGHFFTLICCKNCIVCLKKTKNKRKEAGVGLFLKNLNVNKIIICQLYQNKPLKRLKFYQ